MLGELNLHMEIRVGVDKILHSKCTTVLYSSETCADTEWGKKLMSQRMKSVK